MSPFSIQSKVIDIIASLGSQFDFCPNRNRNNKNEKRWEKKKLLLLHPDPRASAMSFQICGEKKKKRKTPLKLLVLLRVNHGPLPVKGTSAQHAPLIAIIDVRFRKVAVLGIRHIFVPF